MRNRGDSISQKHEPDAHLHILRIISLTTKVQCELCEISLRLATYDEAVFVQMTEGWAQDGPLLGPTGVVVVPESFSLFADPDPAPAGPTH